MKNKTDNNQFRIAKPEFHHLLSWYMQSYLVWFGVITSPAGAPTVPIFPNKAEMMRRSERRTRRRNGTREKCFDLANPGHNSKNKKRTTRKGSDRLTLSCVKFRCSEDFYKRAIHAHGTRHTDLHV